MIANEYNSLCLYHGFGEGSLLANLCAAEKEYTEMGHLDAPTVQALCGSLGDVLALSVDYGLQGDLWQGYLTYLLISHENPFSLSCERVVIDPACTLSALAKCDLAMVRRWFDYDFSNIEAALGTSCLSPLHSYTANEKARHIRNAKAGARIEKLRQALADAPTDDAFFSCVADFYAKHGVGMFGLNHAFSVSEHGKAAEILPIANPSRVTLDAIIGYELQKRELVHNTKAFALGKAANNALLYGDSGTGKSTAIKAVLNEFAHLGLRLIEINKYQFRALSSVISQIKGRNYRFIIYIDDLSFEENESEYKFLKAVIEGGVETNPENVLIYATSNRRHLIRETWKDRSDMEHDGDIHRSDTIEEKLSLAARFGVTINYSVPNRDEYLHIVKTLAQREGLTSADEETLCLEATRWELRHGGISCRTARQFIDYMHSKIDLNEENGGC